MSYNLCSYVFFHQQTFNEIQWIVTVWATTTTTSPTLEKKGAIYQSASGKTTEYLHRLKKKDLKYFRNLAFWGHVC